MRVYTVEGFTLEEGVEVIGVYRCRGEAETVVHDIRKSELFDFVAIKENEL